MIPRVASGAGHKSCRFYFTPTTDDPLSLVVRSLWATPENVSVLVIDENSPTNRRVIYSGDVANFSDGIAVEPGHRYLFYAVAFTGYFNVYLGYGWPVYSQHIVEFDGLSGYEQFLRPVYYAYAYEHEKFYIQVLWVRQDTTGFIAVVDLDLLPAGASDIERTFAKEHACAANNGDADAADPVSTRTGNFTRQEVDVTIPTRGLPLTFERSYNALDNYNGPLGHNWTHNYDTRIVDAGDAVTWIAPRGSHLPYTRNADGSYTAGPGVRATLVKHPNGSYTVTQGDQMAYHFDAAGRLTSLDDGRGAMTTLTYTGDNLTSISAPDGRALSLTYDGQGRITQITDPLGRTTSYNYTIAGNLGAVTDRRGHTWTYIYDNNGRMTAFSDPQGGTVTNVYDNAGRVVAQHDPLNHTTTLAYEDGQTVVTDADNHTTTYIYDAAGLLASVTDALGHTASYTYDDNGNVAAVTDPLSRTTEFTWNDSGCSPAVITGTLGHVTLTYDNANQLTGMQDALGRTTQYGYDGHRLITVTDALSGTVIHTYDANNLRVQTVDHGLTTTYGYDAFGQMIAITDTLGQVTRYGYDAVGRLITTTNPAGQVTVNEYDARDNLLRVTTNYTTAGGQNYLGLYNQVTTYAYSPADLWGESRRTWMTDTHGRVTRYEYDLAGRLVHTTRNYLAGYPQNSYLPPTGGTEGGHYNLVTEYGYDAVGNQVTVTDTLGSVTYTEYDALNRVVRTWQNYLPGHPQNYYLPPSGGTEGGHYNLLTAYGYDATGNQMLITDTLGNVTYTEYDALDRVARTWQNYLPGYPQNYQNTYNRVTEYDYDAVGNQILIIDTLENVTYTSYDALNRPVTMTTNFVDGVYDPNFPTEDLCRVTTYDAAGRVSLIQDHAARLTYHEYDAFGRPVTVTTNYVDGLYDPARPDEDIKQVTVYDDVTARVTARWQIADTVIPTWYEYDVLGRLVTTTNALSGTTVTQYDALGRRSAQTDAAGNTIHYGYDVVGRLVTTTNALGGAAVTQYDALGRRVGHTNPLGHTSVYTYDSAGRLSAQADPLGHVTTYSYDALGRRVAQTDADGVSLYSTYDAAGRLSATCDTLGHCTQHTYDALGRRVAQTDARDVTTAYEYDALGRLTAVVENATTTGLSDYQTNVRTTYTYDLLGYTTAVENALGHTTVYTYDDLGRRTAEADALGHVTAYVYDGHGRRLAAGYPDAGGPFTVTATYNALGWTEEVVYPGVGDAPGFTVNYSYTPLGHRAAVTDATGTLSYDYDALYRPLDVAAPTGDVTYSYDAAGQRTHLIYPTGQTVTYTHDAAGRLTQVRDWSGGTTVYTYTAAGRLSGMARPNGVTSAYSYDAAGRLAQIEHRDAAAHLLVRYTYTLDGVDNRTHIAETVNGATRDIAYTYDPLNRLTTAEYSTGEFYGYQYDAVGNRTAMTDATGAYTYTYDAANRLTGIELPDSKIRTYTWDARGNLIHDGVSTYTYNAAGQMVRAASITATLVYTYNVDGLRIAQADVAYAGAQTYVWDWATGVPEMLYDGQYTYLVGHDTLGWEGARSPMAPVMWTYVLPDALGSVRQETDANGNVTAVREWSPYGEEVGGAQAGLGYTGEWFDTGVGLQYLRARWYQLVTGRFTSRDPWEGNITRPNTLNGFSYVTNNPINLVDPLGLCELYPYFDYDCWALLRTNAAQERLQSQTDPLSGYDYQVVVQEARRFGLPTEFLASVLAAEVKYDTDWHNKVYDVYTTFLDWLQPDYLFLFTSDEPCTWPQLNLELWHYYYGLGPLYLNPEHGFGEGPAPGIGNIHAGVAADTEQYFAENYADENLLPSFKYNWHRLELLRRFEWNVRYVAAYLRQLSDIRTGEKKPHLDLTDTDMKMIFTAYHADLAYCFAPNGEDPIQAYQEATYAYRPECQIYSTQLEPFLDLYRHRR